MNSRILQAAIFVSAGFLLGLGAANLPRAVAAADSSTDDISKKRFMVSIDEVKQNFVFAEEFSGSYKREITLSNGRKRIIELTPMIHNGMKVVEFKDSGGLHYMGLNGRTTNGKLMVQLRDVEQMHAQLEAEGWPDK
jgi:hypothetical protein